MPQHSIYQEIAERTGGDIYIGVVGPVRSGKSTFIRRFMETTVLPNITSEADRLRTLDSMPQAASGRTVMTTEPKFIPDEAVRITLDGGIGLRVRMVDCVGFLVPEALGTEEEGTPRMVRTPWSDSPIPFAEAAELGTRRVISDHSTVCMLVTTDGTVSGIPRESYIEAEETAAAALAGLNKPFAVILNSAHPTSESAVKLAYELERKYNAPVALLNCTELDEEDVRRIMELILSEFPMNEIRFRLPDWLSALSPNHPMRASLSDAVARVSEDTVKVGDLRHLSEYVERISEGDLGTWALSDSDAGKGTARIAVTLPEECYYRVLRELSGLEVSSSSELLREVSELARIKAEYDKVAEALADVREKGYGIVMPDVDELRLEDPKIVKQPGGYGVRLRASAKSIHMIKADIETEINPVVGTEAQSEEIVRYLVGEFEDDPSAIWNSNLFGKSLYDLTSEGIHRKLENMPEESRQKLSETLERIINEGSSGLICILL